MGFEPRRNEFINALVNRIAMVLVTSKSYSNPLAIFKKGYIELGESIEEIFVDIATPFHFDPKTAETNVFKRQIPNVKTMFHTMNYQEFYKQTISNDQLRQAFLSWDGVTDLVSRIVNSMYSAMHYDEYLMTKYIVAVMAINGEIYPFKTSDFSSAANSDKVVTDVKTVSNTMEFMRSDYNIGGVKNFSLKEEQYLVQSSAFSANVDVNSLAKAFNLDYVKFSGRQIMVDSFSFSSDEIARITELLSTDDTFVPSVIFSTDNLALLSSIGALLIDRNFFMIFDNLQEATSIYNPEGLYYNNSLHCWKTFSASPFADAVLFTTNTSSITGITVTPTTATVAKGKSFQLSAVVAGTGFFNKGVTWEITTSGTTATTVSTAGLVSIGTGETKTSITITAKSAQDATKSATCPITVS